MIEEDQAPLLSTGGSHSKLGSGVAEGRYARATHRTYGKNDSSKS